MRLKQFYRGMWLLLIVVLIIGGTKISENIFEKDSLPVPSLSLSPAQTSINVPLFADLIGEHKDLPVHRFSVLEATEGFVAPPNTHVLYQCPDSIPSDITVKDAHGAGIYWDDVHFWGYEFSGNEAENSAQGKTELDLFDGYFWISQSQLDISPNSHIDINTIQTDGSPMKMRGGKSYYVYVDKSTLGDREFFVSCTLKGSAVDELPITDIEELVNGNDYVADDDTTMPDDDDTPSLDKDKSVINDIPQNNDPGELIPFSDTFDTYVSELPTAILAAYEAYGPIQSKLKITVVSHTDPPAEISADVEYVYSGTPHVYGNLDSFSGNYKIANIQTNEKAEEDQLTIFEAKQKPGDWDQSLIALKTGGNEYRITVHIEGDTSESVGSVYLPRYQSLPWKGHKRGLVIKGRHDDSLLDGNSDSYGSNDEKITSKMDFIASSIENMSNGKVTIEYDMLESKFDELPDSCSTYKITSSLLANAGITDQNYKEHYDFQFTSVYDETKDWLESNVNSCKINNEAGMSSHLTNCPQCGPGGWATFSNEVGYSLVQHGLGHGIGFAHPVSASCCGGCKGGELADDPAIVFHTDWNRQSEGCPSALNYRPFGDTMGYGPRNEASYNPLDQAAAGWMESEQIELVTESGIYDLYSDRRDLSSDPTLPRILQVLVHLRGHPDFVYLLIPNYYMANARIGNKEEFRYMHGDGIQLWAGRADKYPAGFEVGRTAYGRSSREGVVYWGQPEIPHTIIPPQQDVHLLWENTDVNIRLLNFVQEGDLMHAQVAIEFNGDNVGPDPALPPAPVLQDTDNGTVGSPPLLTWNSVPDASAYNIRIYHRGRGVAFDFTVPGDQTSYQLQADEYWGFDKEWTGYFWSIQSVNSDGIGSLWSDMGGFKINL
jgi:hypothetical protein